MGGTKRPASVHSDLLCTVRWNQVGGALDRCVPAAGGFRYPVVLSVRNSHRRAVGSYVQQPTTNGDGSWRLSGWWAPILVGASWFSLAVAAEIFRSSPQNDEALARAVAGLLCGMRARGTPDTIRRRT